MVLERKGKENTTLNAIINFTTVNNKLQIDEYLKTILYLQSKLCTKLIIKNHNDLLSNLNLLNTIFIILL